ncbi:hypothetical protein ACIF8W_33880 [Streptomyces sp. NPDC085639]
MTDRGEAVENDDPAPMRLRTYEDEHLMVWYQTIGHRCRPHLKRVDL